MEWRKTIYKITIRIEARKKGREEIPAKNSIRLARFGGRFDITGRLLPE